MDGLRDDLPDLTKFAIKPKKTIGDESVARVVDDELSKIGWSEPARLSFLGDVGRENGWNRSVIFGGHSDPKNNETNRGIISWQGDRRKNLDNYLKSEGVLGKNDDDELRGMVRFADKEMRENKEWQPINAALRDPNISTYDASENLRKYIKYVPEAPYNTPDTEFRVKNNAQWAKKAQSLGLGKLPDLSQYKSDDLPDLAEFAVKSENPPTLSPEQLAAGEQFNSLDLPKGLVRPPTAPTNPVNVVPQVLPPIAPPIQKPIEQTTTLGEIPGTENVFPEPAPSAPLTIADAERMTAGINEQLPADYLEYMKLRELPDSQELRNDYSATLQDVQEAYDNSPVKNAAPPVQPSPSQSPTNTPRTAIKTPENGQSVAASQTTRPKTADDYREITRDVIVPKGVSVRQALNDSTQKILAEAGIDATAADIEAAAAKSRITLSDGSIATDTVLEKYRDQPIPNTVEKSFVRDVLKAKETRLKLQPIKDKIERGEINGTGIYDELFNAGLMTAEQRDAKISEEKRQEFLRESEEEAAKSEYERENSNAANNPYADPAFRRLVSAAYPQDVVESAEGEAQAKQKARAQEILQEYGSFTDYAKEKQRIEKEYEFRPLARPLEAAKTFAKSPVKATSAALKSISIAAEAIDYTLSLKDKDVAAKDRGLYRVGAALDKLREEIAPANKDFKGELATDVFPDTFGQVATQVLVGALSGGAALPTLLGAAQGIEGQYSEAEKYGATQAQKLKAAALGGLLAAPDYFIFKGWFKGASVVEKSRFLSNLTDSIKSKLGVAGLAEAESNALAVQVADSFIQKAAKQGANFLKSGITEGAQEISESKGNDLYAYLSYDPSPERLAKVTTLTKENITEGLAGFFGGLLGAGASVTAERAAALSEPELRQASEILDGLVKTAPDAAPLTEAQRIVEDALDVEPDADGVYRASSDNSNIRARETRGEPAAQKRIGETTPPRELNESNPLRAESPNPEAVQKVAVDSRAQKVVEQIKDGKTVSIDQLQKQTRINKKNLEEVVMNLYGARQIEIMPDNSIRFIGNESVTKPVGLYERIKQNETNPAPEQKQASVQSNDVLPSNEVSVSEKVAPEKVDKLSTSQTGDNLPAQTNQIYEALPQQKAQAEQVAKPVAKVDFAERPNIAEKLNVFTERGRKAQIEPRVVEQSDLLTSLDEGYPQQFQPRDRSRAASKAQISEIAGKLNPEFLGDSPKASDGRPLVVPVSMPDGSTKYAVISGNGRTAGIREAYNLDNEGAKSYARFARSKGNGNERQPVYVGILDPNEVKDISEFAKEANESATAQMSASEQAKTDADRLDASVLNLFVPADDGSIHGAANRDFTRAFLQRAVPTSEQGRLVDAEGKLNQDGANRVRNAIFARAFGESEAGLNAISRMAESTDNNVKNITNGLLAKAGSLAALKEAGKNGSRYQQYDVANDFARAMEKYADLKESGGTIADYINQGSLFGSETTPFQTRVMQVFDHHKRSPKAIRGIIDNYLAVVEALGDPNQQSLFGADEKPSVESVFEGAVKAYENAITATATDRFGLLDDNQGRENQPDTRQESDDDAAKVEKETESNADRRLSKQSQLEKPHFAAAKGEINLEILYNKDGEFDYEQVKNVAGRIGSGELEIARLAPREEQGRIAGGRRNVEASVIVGAVSRTNPAASRGSRQDRDSRIAQNKQIEAHLENYAKHENIWFDYDDFVTKHEYFAKGEEARIYRDSDKKSVLKTVDYAYFDPKYSPLEFIDERISLFNYLFPETKYELVGFTRNNAGRFQFILKQPLIIKHKTPTSRKVSELMKDKLGADSEQTPEQFANQEHHVSDLHKKNVIQDKDGNVFVIDAITELTPERLGGTRQYQQFAIKTPETKTDANSISYSRAARALTAAVTKVRDKNLSDADLLDKAVVKNIGDGTATLNPEATEFTRRMIEKSFDYDSPAPAFYGAQMSAEQAGVVADYVFETYARDKSQPMRDRMKARNLMNDILYAADKTHGDIIVLTATAEHPKGTELAMQEEKGHRALSRSGATKALTVQLDESESFKESLGNIEEKYSDLSPVGKRNEVVAKSFRDDAAAELGISDEQLRDNWKAFLDSLENEKIDLEAVARQFETVSPKGKEFAQNVRDRRERNNAEDVARRTRESDSSAKDLSSARRSGNESRPTATKNDADRIKRLQQASLSGRDRSGNEAIVKSEPRLAPNGKPSNLTPEQYKQVRAEAFKKWFGDWENDAENASKVVDENGEPKVLYHGTSAHFDVYDESKINKDFGGIYLTDSESHGRMFGELRPDAPETSKTLELFANIRQPKLYDAEEQAYQFWQEEDPEGETEFEDFVLSKQGGYLAIGNADELFYDLTFGAKRNNQDGVIVEFGSMPITDDFPDVQMGKVIIAFKPNQIKSAISNNGDFSTARDEITLARTANLYKEIGLAPMFARATPTQKNTLATIFAPIWKGNRETTALEIITNFRRAGLLTGVRTHLKNMASNTLMQASEEASRPLAILADLAASAVTGKRTVQMISMPGLVKSFGALVRQDKTLTSLKKESGIARAWNILKTGDISELDKNQLREMQSGSPILDGLVNYTFRLLGAEDALFKTYAMRRSLEESAKTTAITEHRADKNINISQRRAELLKNPTNEMLLEAELFADYTTFTNNNPVSDAFTAIKNSNPLVKFVAETLVPYDKTPTNVIARTLEYTPLGLGWAGKHLYDLQRGDSYTFAKMRRERLAEQKELDDNRKRARLRANDWFNEKIKNAATPAEKKRLSDRYDILKKKRNLKDVDRQIERDEIEDALDDLFPRIAQQQFARSFGRAGLGSAALGLGIYLAMNGLLSGVWSGGERDEKDEFYDRKDKGILNAALQIGDRRYVIGDTPLGKVLAIGASIFERSGQTMKEDQSKAGKTASDVVDVGSNIVTEQPLLNSLSDYFGSNKTVEQRIGGLLGSFVPTIVADVADVLDDEARDTKSLQSGIMNRIPVLREQNEKAKRPREPYLQEQTNRIIGKFDPLSSRPAGKAIPSIGMSSEQKNAQLEKLRTLRDRTKNATVKANIEKKIAELEK